MFLHSRTYHRTLLGVALLFLCAATGVIDGCRPKAAAELLTPDERRWLETHRGQIRMAPESNYPPFVFVDSRGRLDGISMDYLRLLERKLDVTFERLPAAPLAQNLAKARGLQADILTSLARTPERSAYLLFTTPYFSIPTVVITRAERPTPDLDESAGLSVAVGEGYGVQSYLQRNYPSLAVVPMSDDLACLQAVIFGQVEATVMDLASASFFITTESIFNLKVAGETDFAYHLSMASRRDWPELNRILQKGMTTISPAEHKAIYTRWIQLERHFFVYSRRFWISFSAMAVTVTVIVATLLVLTWNRTLRRQVRQQTEALMRQVAERQHAESALKASEQTARALLNASTDGVVLLDADGTILDVNTGFAQRFSRRPDELQGVCVWDLFPPEVNRSRRAKVERVFASGTAVRFEDDRQGAWNDIVIYPIFDTGRRVNRVAVFAQDITDRKRLMDQLIRAERLAATGQLAASVAHEINSPLQGIASLIGVIKETHAADRELLADLDLLGEGFKRIGDTVKNLLDLNRPGESGKQPADLNRVIRTTMALVRGHLEKNGIRLNLQLSADLPPLFASPQQLGHLFLNLINNAVEAMTGHLAAGHTDAGGVLTIRTRAADGQALITVQDSGPGIAPERLESIFDPFYTEKKRMGMGIGLSICHDIVLDHQGSIVASNASEGGARFDITLPLSPDGNEGYHAKI